MNKPPLWEQYKARLASYEHAKVNYDFSRQHEYNAANGWRLDDSVGSCEVRYVSPVGQLFFAIFWKAWASGIALLADLLGPKRVMQNV